MAENEKYIVGRIEFSEKLPDNWLPLYQQYKKDCQVYLTALISIKKELDNKTPNIEKIDEIVRYALVGDE